MILMRRGERTCEQLVIALLAAGTSISTLRKDMKLFIARYVSYSYNVVLYNAFVSAYKGMTSFFPLKPF